MRRALLFMALATGLLLMAAHPAAAVTGYYRDPAVAGDTLVFAAEGDLWRAPLAGGLATRLTSHLAEERRPAISPDGTQLAFSASYEGPTEVYVMPLAGGLPRRLTWHGEDALVAGWTPDGKILYASPHRSTLPTRQLFRLDPASGASETLPLSQASQGCYGADGQTLFFTRFTAQSSHTKRYQGGMAQDLWRFAPGDAEATPLTADWPGTSHDPMCWRGRIYFASDRDGTMNLWSMDERGGDLRQLTRHTGWDVRSPSLGGGRIVYQLGADLWRLDLATGEDVKIPLELASDLDQLRERWVDAPFDYLSAAALSPTGDRVVATVRGEVWVLPAREGRRVEVARQPGARARRAVFVDETHVLALSDASGEVELWRYPANGVGAAEQLTRDGAILRWEAMPSPDGRWVAYTDKNFRLWLLDVKAGTSRRIAESATADVQDLRWSADSRWLAYALPERNGFLRIYLLRAAQGEPFSLTSERYDSYSPAWSRDGKFLYFLSDRDLESLVGGVWGNRQPDPFLATPTKLYGIALTRDARWPFLPHDELEPKDGGDAEQAPAKDATKKSATDAVTGKKADASPAKDEKPAPAAEVKIDRDGLAERLYEVPVPAGRYGELAAGEKHLFWLSAALTADADQALQALEIGARKPKVETVFGKVDLYRLSPDGKKLLVRQDKDLLVFDAGTKAPDPSADARVDTGGWRLTFTPREEWRQMFLDGWRMLRDYFYDPGMHGADWPAIRAKYLPLVDRVTSRGELSDLLAQLTSELSALHHFVYGGDARKGREKVDVASLGAELERDPAAGGLRVARVYRADPELPGEVAPLARPQSRVEEGELIVAVDGVPALAAPDPGALLRDRAGRQDDDADAAIVSGAIERLDELVVPVDPDAASELRYDDWELERRQRVERLGEGRLGYVHLRAMGGENFAEFAREFYPVADRQGLIVDVRNNRGGNIDSWILGKLMRKAWAFWQGRVGLPYWNMQGAFRGPMVVLVNERTASDGELFAEGFRRLGLGKVLGRRTWGGEIWLTSSNFMVDKGIATAAEFGVYGPEGEWLIEGHGVDPDIVVENLPHATYAGEDAQLAAAIAVLKKEIAEHPNPVPPPPAYPKKARP